MDQSIQDLKRKKNSAPKRENSTCSPHIKIKLLKTSLKLICIKAQKL